MIKLVMKPCKLQEEFDNIDSLGIQYQDSIPAYKKFKEYICQKDFDAFCIFDSLSLYKYACIKTAFNRTELGLNYMYIPIKYVMYKDDNGKLHEFTKELIDELRSKYESES